MYVIRHTARLLGILLCCLVATAGENRTPGARFDAGADIHIAFAGLICHVFDPDHAPRAVIMRGTDEMPHRATLTLLESQIASSEVALSCADGQCTLDLANTGLRFPDRGRPTYEKGGSFDLIVPHLQAVTDGEMSELRDDVFDEVPSPASPMAAYLELPSGSLTTVPFAQLATFHPDYEQRGSRQFPQGVFLTGRVHTPVLLVHRDGRWQRVTFRPDAAIEIRIENEPTDGIADPMHAMLYYSLSRRPLSRQPMIHLSPRTGRGPIASEGLGTGCSNSSFP